MVYIIIYIIIYIWLYLSIYHILKLGGRFAIVKPYLIGAAAAAGRALWAAALGSSAMAPLNHEPLGIMGPGTGDTKMHTARKTGTVVEPCWNLLPLGKAGLINYLLNLNHYKLGGIV